MDTEKENAGDVRTKRGKCGSGKAGGGSKSKRPRSKGGGGGGGLRQRGRGGGGGGSSSSVSSGIPVNACELAFTLKTLRAVQVPKSQRANTKGEGDEDQHGLALGAVSVRRSNLGCMERKTMQKAEVVACTEALNALAENHLPSSFEWTTIQLNLNYLSTLHVDRSNLGASYIIGFDDYDGGELYIYEQGTVCCKGRFVPFDGNTPHMTCAFTGTRYTCIFFVDQGFARISEEQREGLEGVGFRVPLPSSIAGKAAVTKGGKQKLEHARAFIDRNGGSVAEGRPPTRQLKQSTLMGMFGGGGKKPVKEKAKKKAKATEPASSSSSSSSSPSSSSSSSSSFSVTPASPSSPSLFSSPSSSSPSPSSSSSSSSSSPSPSSPSSSSSSSSSSPSPPTASLAQQRRRNRKPVNLMDSASFETTGGGGQAEEAEEAEETEEMEAGETTETEEDTV